MDEAERVNLKVYVRVRPPLKGEGEGCVEVLGKGVRVRGDVVRQFDGAFGGSSTQEEVYRKVVGVQGIKQVAAGYHSTVFLYGQTGSGKTYTAGVSCKESLTPTCGVMPRCIDDIFSFIASDTQHEYKVSVEWIQTYQDAVQDLLSPSSVNLQIRECPDNGVFLVGSQSHELAKPSDFAALSKKAERSRVTALTRMNAHSSRSHSCCIVTVAKRRTLTQADHVTGRHLHDRHITKGKLCIVDLAGSERLKKSLSEGIRKEEAKSINSSLAALGNVLQSLVDRSKHVPYRDSKLTRLLQDSLGGSGFASFIVTVSPAGDSLFESKNTLLFAERAKLVKNAPRVHIEYDQSARFAEIQSALENRINILEARNRILEAEMGERKPTNSEDEDEDEATSAAKLREVYSLLRQRDYELEIMKNKMHDAEASSGEAQKLSEKLAARDSLIVSLRKQIKTPKDTKEVEELKVKMHEREDRLANIELERTDMESRNKQLCEQVRLLTAEKETLTKTRRGLDSVICDFRDRLAQQETDHNAVVLKLRSKETTAQNQQEALLSKYTSLKREMKIFQEEESLAAREDKERVASLSSDLNSLKTAHTKAKREAADEHAAQMNELRMKYEAREKQLSHELSKGTQEHLVLIESSGREVHELQNKLQLETSRNAALKQEAARALDSQREKDDETQVFITSLREEALAEQRHKTALFAEVEQIKEMLSAKETKMATLEQSLKMAEDKRSKEKEAQQHQNKNASLELVSLKEQLDDERRSREVLEREVHVLSSQLESERSQGAALRGEAEILKGRCLGFEETIAILHNSENEQKAVAEAFEKETIQNRCDFNEKLQELQKAMKELAHERDTACHKLEKVMEQNAALQDECSKANADSEAREEKVATLAAEFSAQKATDAAAVEETKEKLKALKTHENKLRMSYNKKIDELHDELGNERQQATVEQRRLREQMEEERKSFDEQKQTYSDIKHNLIKQITELTARVQQRDADNQREIEQKVRAEKEAEKAVQKHRELAVRLSECEEKIQDKEAMYSSGTRDLEYRFKLSTLLHEESARRGCIFAESTQCVMRCCAEISADCVKHISAVKGQKNENNKIIEELAVLEARQDGAQRNARASAQEASMLKSKCTILDEALSKARQDQKETIRDCNKRTDALDASILQLQREVSEKDTRIASLNVVSKRLAEDVEVRSAAFVELQQDKVQIECELEAAKNRAVNLSTDNKKLQHALEISVEGAKEAKVIGVTFRERGEANRAQHEQEISNFRASLSSHQKRNTDLLFMLEEAELQVKLHKRKSEAAQDEVVGLEEKLATSIAERDALHNAILAQDTGEVTAGVSTEGVARIKQLEAEVERLNSAFFDQSAFLASQTEREKELSTQLTKSELHVSSLECTIHVNSATVETLRSELSELHNLLQLSEKQQQKQQLRDSKRTESHVTQLQQQLIREAEIATKMLELDEAESLKDIVYTFGLLKDSLLNAAREEVSASLSKERALRVSLQEEGHKLAALQGDAAKVSVLLKRTLNEVAAKTQTLTEQQNTISKLREDVIRMRAEKDDLQVKCQHQTEMAALDKREFRNKVSILCSEKQQELARIQSDHERMVQLVRTGAGDVVPTQRKVSQEALLRKSMRVNEGRNRNDILLMAKRELAQLLLVGHSGKETIENNSRTSNDIATQTSTRRHQNVVNLTPQTTFMRVVGSATYEPPQRAEDSTQTADVVLQSRTQRGALASYTTCIGTARQVPDTKDSDTQTRTSHDTASMTTQTDTIRLSLTSHTMHIEIPQPVQNTNSTQTQAENITVGAPKVQLASHIQHTVMRTIPHAAGCTQTSFEELVERVETLQVPKAQGCDVGLQCESSSSCTRSTQIGVQVPTRTRAVQSGKSATIAVSAVQAAVTCSAVGVMANMNTETVEISCQTEDEEVYTPKRQLTCRSLRTPPTVPVRNIEHSIEPRQVLNEVQGKYLHKVGTDVDPDGGDGGDLSRLREQITALKHMQVETLFIADAQLKRERLMYTKRLELLENGFEERTSGANSSAATPTPSAKALSAHGGLVPRRLAYLNCP